MRGKVNCDKRRGQVFTGRKKSVISVVLCICVLFAAIALNLLVGVLPSSSTQIDVTTSGIFTLSSDTYEMISSLDGDINIYLICAKGKENSRTVTILNRYDEASDKITVKMIDPAYYPNFVSLHSQETSLTYNSIIVESAKRSQVIRYADYNTSSFFLLEDYINSALNTTTAEKRPVVYTLTGHGETVLSADLISQISLNGFETEEFSFLNAETLPSDAAVLLILNPESDISEKERSLLISYLENGGRMMLITGFSASPYPNLDGVMNSCGLERVSGYICEASNGAYYSSPTYIVPSVQYEPELSSVTEGVAYVLSPVAHGIKPLDNFRGTLRHYPILKTSDYSYAKQDLMSTDTSFSVGDIEGPFCVGMAAVEKIGQLESRVIWFSSSGMLDSKVDSVVSGTNTLLFLNSVNYLCGSEVPTLHAKATSTGTLTVMPKDKAVWSAIMLAVVPGCTLAVGLIVCARRRRF